MLHLPICDLHQTMNRQIHGNLSLAALLEIPMEDCRNHTYNQFRREISV